MKAYRTIEFSAGSTLESAVKQLMEFKRKGETVSGSFNGTVLFSDVDDFDSAYKKVLGMSKAEFDDAEMARQAKYEEEAKMHENSIPEQTKAWIEKGERILDKEFHELWAKCVPIRLGDLYRGMELGCCLDIVEKLNSNCKFSDAKETLDKQGHSGMSHGLVCSMIESFCVRGRKFVKYANL